MLSLMGGFEGLIDEWMEIMMGGWLDRRFDGWMDGFDGEIMNELELLFFLFQRSFIYD